jgi:hypothetical protein
MLDMYADFKPTRESIPPPNVSYQQSVLGLAPNVHPLVSFNISTAFTVSMLTKDSIRTPSPSFFAPQPYIRTNLLSLIPM